MDDLSADILDEVVSYVDSYQTLSRLLCTNRALNQSASKPALWHQLGQLRWPHTWNKSVISTTEDPTEIIRPRQAYQERHEKDRNIYQWIKERAATVDRTTRFGVSIENLRTHPDDSYDFLLILAMRGFGLKKSGCVKPPAYQFCPFRLSTAAETTVAMELFISVHFKSLMHRFYELMVENARGLSDAELVEEGAIMLSESLWTTRDLTHSPIDRVSAIRGAMQQLSSQIELRLEESPLAATDDRAMIAVQELAGKLSGNRGDYYNVLNSSIEHVLKAQCGIPITLAVIYKCVLRRSGIHADIIGLPGHVILGLPGRNYVDVFAGGQALSILDCHRIAAAYGVPWDDFFLHPLTAFQVINRMLNNMLNSQSRLMLNTSKSAEKTKLLSLLLNERSRRALNLWPGRNLSIDADTLTTVNRFGDMD